MTTYSEYWQMVLGPRTSDQVVREFSLVPNSRGIDEWLGTAEEEAIGAGHLPCEETLDAWGAHHSIALDALTVAANRAHRCRCGELTGESCDWTGTRDDMVDYVYCRPQDHETARTLKSTSGLLTSCLVARDHVEALDELTAEWPR